MQFRFNVPVEVQFAAGVSAEAAAHLNKLGGHKPLVVTDAALLQLEWFQKWLGHIQARNTPVVVFEGVVTEPDEEMINRGAVMFQAHHCDSVIGIGGGSALDSAKAINILAFHKGTEIREFLRPLSRAIVGQYPMILIPTTSGTGAEITRGTVVTLAETGAKIGFGGGGCYADVALIDPTLTTSLPKSLVASSGLDAFCHALESFVANRDYPIGYMLSKEALRLILESLPAKYENPNDAPSSEKMALASLLATMAFSTGGGLSYPHHIADVIGPRYKIPHGFACAMNIAATLERMWELEQLSAEKVQDLHLLFGENPVVAVRDLLARVDAPQLADVVADDEATLRNIAEEVLRYSFRADVYNIEEMHDVICRSIRQTVSQ